MKTKLNFTLLILMLWISGTALAQEQTLSIDDCQEKARNNYPLIRQYGLLEQSKEYTLSNLSKGNLPQVSLNAQATYQSEVVGLPISLPGISVPTMDKDQYKATLDVSQTIWDGGAIHTQRKIEEARNEVDKQNVEVNLYAIRERVNQLYFGLLTVDAQLKQLNILEEDLKNSFNLVNAFLANGTGTQSDVDALQVELLNTEQRKIELNSFRTAYGQMLSALIHEKITGQTQFLKPVDSRIDELASISRPEISMFEKQRQLFDVQENLIDVKNRPKFGLFVQGGYGKPGLNMLKNEFDFFAIGGLKMSWNFGNLYTRSNEKRLVTTNKNLLNTQEETFTFNTNLQLTQLNNEVQKAKELMRKDDEIIMLRARVKQAAESKYENGVYTVNDLIKDINSENQSRQAKILHEIQYLLNVYNYKNVQGNQ